MESSGYVEQGGRAGVGARLDVATVVQRGRWREFRRTLLIAALLVVLQVPLRAVVMGDLDSAYGFGDVVPARLSFIIDALFVLAYVFVAYRAFGIIRSCRPRKWALRLNQLGLAVVCVGAVLDLWEDTRLWVLFGDGPHDLTVGFGELFSDGDDGSGYTILMRVVVFVGFVIQAASFVGYRRASAGGRPALADVPGPGAGGTVICCSGGGIRSSAFSLGGLQALTDAGIYSSARAVIGVSGGGYVGAAYHVLRWNPVDGSVNGADWTHPQDDQPAFAPVQS